MQAGSREEFACLGLGLRLRAFIRLCPGPALVFFDLVEGSLYHGDLVLEKPA